TEGKVTIYIDSSASGDGKCGSAGTPTVTKSNCKIYKTVGTFTMMKSDFYNPSRLAGNLQIYVYGNGPQPPECEIEKTAAGVINIENEGNPKSGTTVLTTAGEIYAPDSYLT